MLLVARLEEIVNSDSKSLINKRNYDRILSDTISCKGLKVTCLDGLYEPCKNADLNYVKGI